MLTGAALGIGALVALLAIPVSLRFRLSWPEPRERDLVLGWAFGLVRWRLPDADVAAPDSQHSDPDRAVRRRSNPSDFLAALRRGDFRRRMARYAADVWHALRRRDVCVGLTLGLGDPADTGRLWALIGPIAGLLSGFDTLDVRIEPDFRDERIDFSGRGELRVVPLHVIALTLGLLLSPPFWRGIGAMRRGRA